jgi:3-deoxy-D-manno-octulosonic-acid transferase
MKGPAIALSAYRAAVWALGPLARPYLEQRAKAGKEDHARLGERLGEASRPRPPGPLVWLHGASVGETLVLLQLHAVLAKARPDVAFLFTSATRTAAEIVARRDPARAQHQFAPIDREDAVARFLAHWRPDFALFAESELWPNLLVRTKATGARLALVNARMSPESRAAWARWPASAARVFSAFDLVLAADAATAAAIGALGARDVRPIGNLKLAAPAPPIDEARRARIAAAIGARPVWLAASTHAGEDDIVLAAHTKIRAARADALLILAPRHPERGAAIAALAGGAPRLSKDDAPGSDDAVLVADVMGEMGTLYALAPVSLIAGSLLPHLRGHNPIEPAKLGSAILAGPHVESFADIYAALSPARRTVSDAEEIAAGVLDLWTDEPARRALTEAARTIVSGGEDALAAAETALLALAPR